MKNGFFTLLLCLNVLFVQAQQTKQKKTFTIGLLQEGLQQDERNAVNTFIKGQSGLSMKQLTFNQLLDGSYKRLHLTHIWIHQLAGQKSNIQEKASGHILKQYVENGGNLILSMEAVRLLNVWGVEKNQFQVKEDSVVDEGFGRPLGFHAFKSHPVFAGLNGGVYSWKGKKDHVIRKIGFFDEEMPDTALAKVIGIEWTYITFHEQNKLVLEYKMGKGKIIAVGAYSYFAADNFNKLQLERFYRNLFDYTGGVIKDVNVHYWSYQPQRVLPLKKTFEPVRAVGSSRWKIPTLSMQIEKKEATSDFVNLAGRRLVLMGKQNGGIDEIWTNPFMSFRDVEAGLVFKGADTAIWLKTLKPSVIVSPEMLVRTYHVNGAVIREITTVSMDKPIAVVHYEYEGIALKQIVMRFSSNFRYMWPYSEKVSATINYRWAPEMNALVSTAQGGSLANTIGFSFRPDKTKIGQFQDLTFKDGELEGRQTKLNQLSGIFSFNTSPSGGNLSTYLVAGNEGLTQTLRLYKEQSAGFEKIYQRSSQYFKNLLHHTMQVTTPDEQFNEGYRWAIARTDQFFQETPGLGTSLMAGFGTTAKGWNGGQKLSGRPGYTWYFGRDAEWSGMAINAYGGHKLVKQVLQVFTNFQDLNGKIYHELTSSGAVHYDAADATPLYVVLAANYLKYSGDVDYIRKIWPSITKAMNFCYSTDTDHDGLIESTNVGHGWIEGGPLFGAHTEIYLAGCWVAALDAASYLSAALKLPDQAHAFNTDVAKVRKIIDQEFWDKEGQYFYNGKMADGSFMKEETVLSSVPVYFNAVSNPAKASRVTASLAGNEYSSDWGVRILPESSKLFNPGAYHAGMVWPLFTGYTALAEYNTGRYTSGFTHIMNNLSLYRHWALGSAEETLNGSVFKPAGICSQQGWSETMILQPVAEGMLGLSCDALTNKFSLSPRFPWEWNHVGVKSISFGSHVINFHMERLAGATIYKFAYLVGKGAHVNFHPSFLPGTVIEKVLVNGKALDFSVIRGAESYELHIGELYLGAETKVEVIYHGGIGALSAVNEPIAGEANQGLKILSQALQGDQFKINVEGLHNRTYEVKVLSNVQIKSVINGEIANKKGQVYTIRIKTNNDAKKYVQHELVINLFGS